ncbi:MAG: hypothetical protein Q7O66_22770 [Dehalococcoidia bacterium]|nr:hypothetical protein [Dehalococcoidia bacterium]
MAIDRQPSGPGGQIQLGLTLYWRVDGEVTKDYKIFVHLLDSAGTIVAQKDSEPLDGNYPTSFWQKGEEFSDRYSLPLRADQLGLIRSARVGFYDPTAGSRLTLDIGADSLVISLAGIAPR